MATDVDKRIAHDIHRMLSNWSSYLGKISIFDAQGSETVDEDEARHFFARDLNMMVVFDDDPGSRSVTVNFGESIDTGNKTIMGMWDTFRKAIRDKFQISCNVRRHTGSIAPRDFSAGAKRRVSRMREAVESKVAQVARTPEGAEAILRHVTEGGSMGDGMGLAIMEMDRHSGGGSAEDRAALERMGTPGGYAEARAAAGA